MCNRIGVTVIRSIRVVFISLIVSVVSTNSQSFAQRAYEEFRPPWFAEAVRLGDAYTAVARGLAAVQHNPAGLAAQKGYAALFNANTGMLLFSDYDKVIGSGDIHPDLTAEEVSVTLRVRAGRFCRYAPRAGSAFPG